MLVQLKLTIFWSCARWLRCRWRSRRWANPRCSKPWSWSDHRDTATRRTGWSRWSGRTCTAPSNPEWLAAGNCRWRRPGKRWRPMKWGRLRWDCRRRAASWLLLPSIATSRLPARRWASLLAPTSSRTSRSVVICQDNLQEDLRRQKTKISKRSTFLWGRASKVPPQNKWTKFHFKDKQLIFKL